VDVGSEKLIRCALGEQRSGALGTQPLPVATAQGRVEEADSEEIKRLGDNPILLQFRLDNGASIQLAAPGVPRCVSAVVAR